MTVVASRTCTTTFVTSPAVSWQFVVERGHEVEPLRFEPQGEQGVGTRNHLGPPVIGRWFTAVSRTVEWSPPSRCVFESVRPARPVRARITEEFHARPGGGTTHTITYEVVPTMVVGRLVAPVLAAVMIRNRRGYQRRLAQALAAT